MLDIQIIGIPSNAGALFEGTESAPQAIRTAGLVQALIEKGFVVKDLGDLLNEVTLPRHNIGPVRNWPAPRMVWEEIDHRANEIFKDDVFTILLGGDCSIEVGTFHAFQKVFGTNSHLLVLDGHIDTMKPVGDTCIGAAGMGLWFLIEPERMWWKGEAINPSNISILGPQQNISNDANLNVLSYEQLTISSYLTNVQEHLNCIHSDSILVHLDVDVLHKSIMPAAYAPSDIGLNLQTASEILKLILSDTRVKAIEITEYSAIKDTNYTSAKKIIDLISQLSLKGQ